MSRISLKIVGAQGQGIDSIGGVLAKALKRSGFCVFGYREYMSLIKGGHASYQLDVSDRTIRSTECTVDVLVCLNHHGLEQNLHDVKQGGAIVHDVADWKFSGRDRAFLKKQKIRVICLPLMEILCKLGAKPILGNVLLAAFTWAVLGQPRKTLQSLVVERFAKKKELLPLNMRCIEEGFAYHRKKASRVRVKLPKPKPAWKRQLLITGSEAMGLGAVHAGCRFYAGYPMTPSSPLLSYIAEIQDQTGMVVKQAEDEITAAQMASGAMFMGTRGLTATSGGGFDLMSETVSMNGIIENPTVFVLAQRPGPATGLPTWTAQGDLLLAVHTSHGEFARCVLSVSDSEDCFGLMSEAFNLAEEFQTPVIVMTDKQTAEALHTQPPFDLKKARIRRGRLVTDPKALQKLKGADRYDPKAKDGVSLRWLPGAQAATYCAQADEHNADGSVDETSANTIAQFDKRLRKMGALERRVPEPTLYRGKSEIRNPVKGRGPHGTLRPKSETLDLLLVGWGSTKGPMLDVIEELTTHNSQLTTAYLHYTYLWPLKVERFTRLAKAAKKIVLVEGNAQGQLGMLLKQRSGVDISDKILKYDGRPFFTDELLSHVQKFL